MAEIFTMPKLGMDMIEGLVARWVKAEGDSVQKGELLAEIETDKAVVEVEATTSGVMLKIFHEEGAAVECGTPIAFIGQPGQAVPDPAAPVAAPKAEAAAPAASRRYEGRHLYHFQSGYVRGGFLYRHRQPAGNLYSGSGQDRGQSRGGGRSDRRPPHDEPVPFL